MDAQRLRSAFLGSKLRIAGSILLFLVVVVVGAFALGFLGVPSVEGVQNGFGPVNQSTTVIETEVLIDNPNPFSIDLGLSAEYGVTMNGVAVANGTANDLTIGAGSSGISLRTYMDNERIPPWWVSHVRNGEQSTVRVDATVTSSLLGRDFSFEDGRTVRTDVLSSFNSDRTRPVDAGRPGVPDPVAYVNETSATWGTVDGDRTEIDVTAVVYNPHPVPIPVSDLEYEIRMNGITVGNGSLEGTYVVPPRGTETFDTTVAIRNQNLDEWWVSHVRNDQTTEIVVEYDAVVDLSNLGGAKVPLEPFYETRTTFETDLFGNKSDGS